MSFNRVEAVSPEREREILIGKLADRVAELINGYILGNPGLKEVSGDEIIELLEKDFLIKNISKEIIRKGFIEPVINIPKRIILRPGPFRQVANWFVGACQGGWKKVTAVFRKPPKLPGGSGVIFIGAIALGAATEARAFNYAPDSGNAPKTDNGAKELIRKIRRLP